MAAAFDAAISAIYEAAVSPREWSNALEKVADFVGGDGAMIVHNDIRNRTGAIVIGRLRDDLSDLYIERHCSNPLVMSVAERSRIGQAALGSSFIDRAELRLTEFHADILAPQRIADQVLIPHGTLSPVGSTGGFAVTMNSRQTDDAAGAIERLTRLGPHLSRAFDLSLEVARYQDGQNRLGALLDVLPTAALLLDGARRITMTNHAADALLRRRDGLGIAPGALLHAVLPEDDRRLGKALTDAIAFSAGAMDRGFDQALMLRRRSGAPTLLVVITPLPRAKFRFLDATSARAAVLVRVIDPGHQQRGITELLRTGYGLTAAEARVASMVARGLTTPQVAAKLAISVNTVRTHLSRAFEKTGAHSQVALARLVGMAGPVELGMPIKDPGG